MVRSSVTALVIVCGCVPLLLFQAGSLHAWNRFPQATEKPEPFDEAALRQALSDAVRKDTALHGSWARVNVGPDKDLEIVLVIDSDPTVGAAQEKLLREIVRKNTSAKFDKFGPSEKLPVAALLTRIITEAEDNQSLAGIRVTDAYYYPRDTTEDRLYLKLVGSLTSVHQAETLRKVCNEKLVPAVLGEKQASTLIIDTDPVTDPSELDLGLTLRQPSREGASNDFSLGMEAFIAADYPKALSLLTAASQDDIRRAEIKYWRAAALIAVKREDRAREIVRQLTPTNGNKVPYYTSDVLHSLERLNGPTRRLIRQKLDALVREALAKR